MSQKMGIEHLLAAAIIAAGGTLTVSANDVGSEQMDGKNMEISYDVIAETITLRLVEYGDK
jgi:hypothetical protein